MMRIFNAIVLVIVTVFLNGCNSTAHIDAVSASTSTQSEDEKANGLYEQIFQTWLARSPEFRTYLGIKTDYDKWDEVTEAYEQQGQALNIAHLQQLHQIDVSQLSDGVALSYRLMEKNLQSHIDNFKWRYHNYPVNQMFGFHTGVAAFLINQHTVENIAEAEAYIARLEGINELFDDHFIGLDARAQKGIIPPKFVFPKAIEACNNLISGAPFSDPTGASTKDSALWSDIKKKVNALTIDERKKAQLLDRAKLALVDEIKPAYQKLIAKLESQQAMADDRAGVWKFPDGEAFYSAKLKKTTTTDLTADQIHAIGLTEVARIQDEMRVIMKTVGFTGSLQEFFVHLREDDQFYYPSNEEGRKAYLARTDEVITEISQKLDKLFITKPMAELVVKPVEAFRAKSAGKAFYQSPPPDGSRPGIYYANLYNMREMPKYQLEALVYHEGLPGHHLQLSLAKELQDVPNFRKHSRYTAYTEGWGLYAEYLPKTIGLYQDPYSDFGRLAMELWRACRLVTDTGIHAKRWNREQAIDYLVQNTPNAERDSRKAIERYIVMPSQATAYKIGMIKLMALRKKSQARLGEQFDIREFHEQVLRLGAVPLNVLEERIDLWLSRSTYPH